jgi:hypothetical protein
MRYFRTQPRERPYFSLYPNVSTVGSNFSAFEKILATIRYEGGGSCAHLWDTYSPLMQFEPNNAFLNGEEYDGPSDLHYKNPTFQNFVFASPKLKNAISSVVGDHVEFYPVQYTEGELYLMHIKPCIDAFDYPNWPYEWGYASAGTTLWPSNKPGYEGPKEVKGWDVNALTVFEYKKIQDYPIFRLPYRLSQSHIYINEDVYKAIAPHLNPKLDLQLKVELYHVWNSENPFWEDFGPEEFQDGMSQSDFEKIRDEYHAKMKALGKPITPGTTRNSTVNYKSIDRSSLETKFLAAIQFVNQTLNSNLTTESAPATICKAIQDTVQTLIATEQLHPPQEVLAAIGTLYAEQITRAYNWTWIQHSGYAAVVAPDYRCYFLADPAFVVFFPILPLFFTDPNVHLNVMQFFGGLEQSQSKQLPNAMKQFRLIPETV